MAGEPIPSYVRRTHVAVLCVISLTDMGRENPDLQWEDVYAPANIKTNIGSGAQRFAARLAMLSLTDKRPDLLPDEPRTGVARDHHRADRADGDERGDAVQHSPHPRRRSDAAPL